MITGGNRIDPYMASIAKAIAVKVNETETEYWHGWQKAVYAGQVNELFTVWDFTDPFVSHVYDEWAKHLDPYGISLNSSSGDYRCMYFGKEVEVDDSKFKKHVLLTNITYEKGKWEASANVNWFNQHGKLVKHTYRHKEIPANWAFKLVDGYRAHSGRDGLLGFFVKYGDRGAKAIGDLKKAYRENSDLRFKCQTLENKLKEFDKCPKNAN